MLSSPARISSKIELSGFCPRRKIVQSKVAKMVETPQYNPPVDLRVSGNSNDTSKFQNQHVDFWSIFEILIFQVFAHGIKIVQPKVAKNGGNPSV